MATNVATAPPEGLSAVMNGLGTPAMMLLMLAMIVLPLPPTALDILFTFNIALSIIVLMASIYSTRPLDFGVFPTVLLIATLMRLGLNVASTRVVLLDGHTGPGAAGKVIEAFGEFVVGGSFAVGLVLFTILVVINFVVVTKGAGRVSEVTARFTLDAMPGKQMAIDADLNAGLISQQEAIERRAGPYLFYECYTKRFMYLKFHFCEVSEVSFWVWTHSRYHRYIFYKDIMITCQNIYAFLIVLIELLPVLLLR